MKKVLNPNTTLVELIKKGLEKKGGYCPCKLERIEDNKCPCKEYRETGHCHCGLYIE